MSYFLLFQRQFSLTDKTFVQAPFSALQSKCVFQLLKFYLFLSAFSLFCFVRLSGFLRGVLRFRIECLRNKSQVLILYSITFLLPIILGCRTKLEKNENMVYYIIWA